RRKARRPADRATRQVRAAHQPEYRQGDWSEHSKGNSVSCRRGDSVRRILALVAALTLSVPLFAQPRVPVIGYLGAETPDAFASRLAALRQGLAEMSYVEGRNVAIEYRWAEGDNGRMPQLAAELVAKKVTLLVTPGIAAALAAKKASSTI